MKLFKLTDLLALGLVLGLAGAGCKHKTPPTTTFPDGPNNGLTGGHNRGLEGGGKIQENNGPIQTGGGELPSFDPDSMNQDRGALAAQTVYFSLDSSVIREGERSMLDAVASALR